MKRNYFIHRISHEWEISYPLLDMGYLSIGWSSYLDSDILERIETGGESAFNDFMWEKKNTYRSRWNLWYFFQFKEGDYIVIPLFDKKFSICEVTGKPTSILALKGKTIKVTEEKSAPVGDNGIVGSDGRRYDIGFIVPVKEIKCMPRAYADASLVSRMKIRQTNARIDDLASSVNEALESDGPVNIHEKIMFSVSDSLKETIKKYITPDDLEEVVRWYFLKKGADRAWIPAKNEAGKENGADVDVIAEFEDLGLVYYVQVKNHWGETGDWAVNQISEYNRQKQDGRDGITYIPWVVTMANEYSGTAVELSKESGVRLINGDEFVEMILNVGLDGIENAIGKNML